MRDVGVVVVDDQEPFRRAAAAVIAATEGFVLLAHAGDGQEALGAVRDRRPDLVLMDVGLPGMDGLAVTRLVRQEDDPPVVVLLSTYSLEELGDEAGECGAAAYLPKEAFDSSSLRRIWDEVGVLPDQAG